jgi:hypothetical protein
MTCFCRLVEFDAAAASARYSLTEPKLSHA